MEEAVPGRDHEQPGYRVWHFDHVGLQMHRRNPQGTAGAIIDLAAQERETAPRQIDHTIEKIWPHIASPACGRP
jgi:hypothetical protein